MIFSAPFKSFLTQPFLIDDQHAFSLLRGHRLNVAPRVLLKIANKYCANSLTI